MYIVSKIYILCTKSDSITNISNSLKRNELKELRTKALGTNKR